MSVFRPALAPVVAATLLLALCSTSALAGPKQKEVEAAAARQAAADQTAAERLKPTVVVEVDFDEDGVVDVKNYYIDDGSTRTMVRKETDLNLDGAIDVVTIFDAQGVMISESMDGDFDGSFDWTDRYESGKRVKAEVDTDYNGIPDVFNYYSNDKVTRKERDTNGDGNVDYWETFDASGSRIAGSSDTTEEAIGAELDAAIEETTEE